MHCIATVPQPVIDQCPISGTDKLFHPRKCCQLLDLASLADLCSSVYLALSNLLSCFKFGLLLTGCHFASEFSNGVSFSAAHPLVEREFVKLSKLDSA